MTKTNRTISVERRTLALFWRLCTQHRQFWLAIFIPVSNIAVGTVVPLYIGKTLATLGNPTADHFRYLLPLTLAALVGFVTNRIGYVNLIAVQAKVQSQVQIMALDTLLKRSVGFHNNRVSGKLVSDANDLQQAFNSLSNTLLVNVLPLTVILISGVVLVTVNSLVLGLALLTMSSVIIGMSIKVTLGRSGLRTARHEASKKVISHMADTIVNLQTVKTFAQEDSELAAHKKLNENLLDLRLSDWVLAARSNNIRVGALLLFQIAFIIVVILVTRHDPTQLATGIFAFSYTITLTNRLLDIGAIIRTIEDGFLQATSMVQVMGELPEILDKPGASALDAKEGVIELKDVNFRYHDDSSNQDVFEKLNLSIKRGEKIGLVGPSGGGKSTLARLLLRFEDIDSGCISIDGQDVAAVTQESLRRAIAYVPQDPLLFHRPISQNIAYGEASASLKDVKSAAKKAYADDFIDSLPKGYDTVVGERGVKLSGGQRQRVAIARAILKNAPILILDEATSALDSESEKVIQKALWELMKNKTAVVIAHRLSTIREMDRIIVLDNGKIIEQGTHDELLKHSGMYAKLWAHQSGGFIEE